MSCNIAGSVCYIDLFPWLTSGLKSSNKLEGRSIVLWLENWLTGVILVVGPQIGGPSKWGRESREGEVLLLLVVRTKEIVELGRMNIDPHAVHSLPMDWFVRNYSC